MDDADYFVGGGVLRAQPLIEPEQRRGNFWILIAQALD
jgi:hypothetical protein